MAWHSEQNKTLRQCGASQEWMRLEIGGRFLATCGGTFQRLGHDLQRVGFLTDMRSLEGRPEGLPEPEGAEVAREDEYAKLIGLLCVELIDRSSVEAMSVVLGRMARAIGDVAVNAE